MIRAVLLGLNIHEERQKGVEKFCEEQARLEALEEPREATWEECKQHFVTYDGKIKNNPATKKAMGIANNAMEKIEAQSKEIALTQDAAVAQQENIDKQQEKIDMLEGKVVALLAAVQQQTAQASIAPPAPPVTQSVC